MCKYIGFQIITLIALLSFISHNCMGEFYGWGLVDGELERVQLD